MTSIHIFFSNCELRDLSSQIILFWLGNLTHQKSQRRKKKDWLAQNH